VKARGGFEVDFEWENEKLTRVIVLSTAGKICKIMLPNGLKEFETDKGKSYDVLSILDE
jgi:alpha-L-fucosidase 2